MSARRSGSLPIFAFVAAILIFSILVNYLAASSAGKLRTAAFLLTIAGNLGFLAWAQRRVSGAVRGRDAAIDEALRREMLLSATLTSIGDAVIVTDAEGRITTFNAEAERLTGFTSSETVGRPLAAVFKIVDKATRAVQESPVEKVRRLGTAAGLLDHTILVAKNGREIPIDNSAAPIRQRDGPLVGAVLVFRDVSDRIKNAETSARLAAIVSSSEDAIIGKDLNGTILSWNTAAERIFGYTASEAVGRPISLIIPEDRQTEERIILDRIRRGESVGHFDTVRRRKGGDMVEISLTVSPIRNLEGETIGASKIARDITKRKDSEATARQAAENLRVFADSLEQRVNERTAELRDSVAELESFSYTISHDLRAPLRSMQGFARIMLEDYGEKLDSQGKAYLERISTAAVRMDQLILDVLTLSNVARSELKLVPVDLQAILDSVLSSYPNLQAPKAEIVVENRLPLVLGNEAALTQCLSNLLTNAVKFVAPEKRPFIRIRSEEAGDRVRLLIQDNGIGIPKEAQSWIFEIFKRVSKSYEGTGIGLAIVRKAAERMGGRVEVSSEPGKGSTFSLILQTAHPWAEGKSPQMPPLGAIEFT